MPLLLFFFFNISVTNGRNPFDFGYSGVIFTFTTAVVNKKRDIMYAPTSIYTIKCVKEKFEIVY